MKPSAATAEQLPNGESTPEQNRHFESYVGELAGELKPRAEDRFLRGLDFVRRTETSRPRTAGVPSEGLDASRRLVAEGNALQCRGNLTDARKCYQDALDIDPTFAVAHNNIGNIRAQLCDYKGAIRDFDAAIRFDPAYVAAFNNRGNAHQRLGNLDSAIADYDRAVELDPTFAYAFNNRGNARTELGQLREAVEDFTKAQDLDAFYEEAFNNRGAVRCELGELDAALHDFDEAIRINPFYAGAFANRGDAHLKLGRAERAIEDYERYLGLGGGILDGDHVEVVALIEAIRKHIRD